MKKEKVFYAIVNKSTRRYGKRLHPATIDERLPVYWYKRVALKKLLEFGFWGRYEVVKVALYEP